MFLALTSPIVLSLATWLQSVRVWEGLQQIGLLSPQGYLLGDPSEETVSPALCCIRVAQLARLGPRLLGSG